MTKDILTCFYLIYKTERRFETVTVIKGFKNKPDLRKCSFSGIQCRSQGRVVNMQRGTCELLTAELSAGAN